VHHVAVLDLDLHPAAEVVVRIIRVHDVHAPAVQGVDHFADSFLAAVPGALRAFQGGRQGAAAVARHAVGQGGGQVQGPVLALYVQEIALVVGVGQLQRGQRPEPVPGGVIGAQG
jgi:hypothetical protein